MNENSHLKHVFWLTIATIFISTSGALGKFIAMPPPVIVWWRSALAAFFLLFFCFYKKIDLNIHRRTHFWTFVLSALFMGAHWITYFYALKLSNVAIGMLSLFTFPVITAILEPLFSNVKFDVVHLFLGLLVLLGIYLLIPNFSLESKQLAGVLLGLISAVCYSLRTLILKRHIGAYNSTVLMFYQVLILSAILIPVLFFMDTSGIKTQIPYVILLALLTTAIGHTMFVNSLKYFKVSTASIIGSAQPVFGIIIAYFFLNEIPTIHTFYGGSLIVLTVMIESIRSRK